MPHFEKTSKIDAPARTVFAWHQSPDALKALIPPWEPVTVEQPAKTLGNGDIAILVMRMGPLKLRWVAEHSNLIDLGDLGGEFTDTQLKGPFARWVHRHVIRADGPNACILEDQIDYALPLAPLGQLLAGWHVRRKLQKMFDYRHDATRRAVGAEQSGATR